MVINWNRKPRGQTIVARVAREYQMKKAGIETRTPEQIQEAAEKRRKVERWWSLYGKDSGK